MDFIYEEISRKYPIKRKEHTDGVIQTAALLATVYGVDVEKARAAALLHDMFRGIKKDAMNQYVTQLALPEKYIDNPNLAHGKVAAGKLQREFGIADEDLLNAVAYHTTGRDGMSALEKVIFLADAIEPGRQYPGVEDIRRVAHHNLDQACLMCLERTIQHINEKGEYLDPDTVHARDWFQKKENIHE